MCVNGLASIAEMTGQMYFGRAGDKAVAWLDRWANQIEGRGACRMPDGAIRFMRSALKVFAADIAAHRSGRPCVGANGKTWLAVPKSSDDWR
jgi:NADH:ubiquinone oxidoreductase subunit F (NADH-binding)